MEMTQHLYNIRKPMNLICSDYDDSILVIINKARTEMKKSFNKLKTILHEHQRQQKPKNHIYSNINKQSTNKQAKFFLFNNFKKIYISRKYV